MTMIEVQTRPKFDVGPYPYDLPWGSSGLLGIIGMAGLWLLMAMVLTEVISRTSAEPASKPPASSSTRTSSFQPQPTQE